MYETEKQFANLWMKPSTNTPVDDAWNRKPIIYDGLRISGEGESEINPFPHSFIHSLFTRTILYNNKKKDLECCIKSTNATYTCAIDWLYI